MTWSFLHPDRLWLLFALPVLLGGYLYGLTRRRRRALRFSNVALIDKVAPRRGGWGRHLLAAVQLLGLGVGILGIAQPVAPVKVPKDRATIMLALDTSLSMKATDVTPSRISAAKKAAIKFVDTLPKKLNVGLVNFAGTAQEDVRPTTDRGAVTSAVRSLHLGEGTAIGDAVKTSLDAIAEMPKDSSGHKAPGVIVLLSDGATTMGTKTDAAGPLAKAAGVPVFTIAYGTPDGVVDITLPETGETARIRVPVDSQALSELATATGGKSFLAQSASDLTQVYQKLGDAIGYDTEHHDVTWRYLVAAMATLGLASLVGAMFFQRLP
jgi:Ca-activated chloride channel family protein